MLIPSDPPWDRSAPENKPAPQAQSAAGEPFADEQTKPAMQTDPQGEPGQASQPEPQTPSPDAAQSPAPESSPEQTTPDGPADQVVHDITQSASPDNTQQQTQQESAPAEPQPQEPVTQGPTVVVRYGLMNSIGEFRHNLSKPPRFCQKVVVRSERGVEIGQVVSTVCDEEGTVCLTGKRLKDYLSANGQEYPFKRGGKVLRLANAQDLIEQRHLEGSAREAAIYCRQQIRELNLPMKLVTVEYLLGGEKIIFYFSSESRVDFRELVRRLASQYRTRVEMRQVGSRDEARLVGDYERCGQRCCCQQYLKDLKPVSMRMAKVQKATLDPTKISGRCGRLMCCLRYEDDVYSELRTRLPRKNTWVRTEKFVGKVVDGQILTQLVKITKTDGEQVVVAIEEILERDVPPPPNAIPDQQPGQQGKGAQDRHRSNGRQDRSGRQHTGQAKPAGQPQETAHEPAETDDSIDLPAGDDQTFQSRPDEERHAETPADERPIEQREDQSASPENAPGDSDESDDPSQESQQENNPASGQQAQTDAVQQTQPGQQNQQPGQGQNNQRQQGKQFHHGHGRGRRHRRDRNKRQGGGGGQQQQNRPPNQGG